MTQRLSPTQVRLLDQIATERFGIPSLLLMEHASLGLAKLATTTALPNQRIVCVCGRGNNGGDGIAAARHLDRWGHPTKIVLAYPAEDYARSLDAWTNLEMARKGGLKIQEFPSPLEAAEDTTSWPRGDLVLDGLLGTGLEGAVRRPLLSLLEAVSERYGPDQVIAIDIPSGLSGTNGEPLPFAIRAGKTATFAFEKTGFGNPSSRAYTGDITVVDIGFPPSMSRDPQLYAPP